MIKIFKGFADSKYLGTFVALRFYGSGILDKESYQSVYYYANQPVICNREEFPDGGILFK